MGERQGWVISIISRSAFFPTSREPISSPRPMAFAASMVAIRRTFPAGNTEGFRTLHLFRIAVNFISLNILLQLFPGA